jgi:hypothetical protein
MPGGGLLKTACERYYYRFFTAVVRLSSARPAKNGREKR